MRTEVPNRLSPRRKRGTSLACASGSEWHIITGEYPPQVGGVAAYTEQVAAALADYGWSVHVWCPSGNGPEMVPDTFFPAVHRLAGGFSPFQFIALGAELNRFPRPRTLLVQYVSNAFGMRGCNIIFCLWLLVRRYWHGDDVRVMFHEPFFYFARQSLQRNLLALITRLMAALLLLASRVVYVSIPAWRDLLRPYCWLRRPPMAWLPIPATIPYEQDAQTVAALRQACTGGDPHKQVVGHFGSYFALITPGLMAILDQLLANRPEIRIKLLGSGGERFAGEVLALHPKWKGRLSAPGCLSPRDVSLHLQACDLLIQPYPDGASSRRTSLMAGLANGVPTVTTSGPFTEPIWWESGAIPLVKAGDITSITAVAGELLSDSRRRRQVGIQGRLFYERNFSLRRSLATLLSGAEPEAPASDTAIPRLRFRLGPRSKVAS
jgi:glycosyltransferase involved in cell wall biosynthesis